MGMILTLRKVTDVQAAGFLRRPKSVIWFLTGFENDRRLMQKLSGAKWEEPGADEQIDLDKAWHGLHFLFTGTAYEGEPPAAYLQAGHPIGTKELGYGIPFWRSAQETVEFDMYLKSLSDAELNARYDVNRMTELEIYPDIWQENTEGLDYLLEHFHRLRAFIAGTVAENKGFLSFVS